ncbi:MAG: GAF domain-containing protein [Bacteroidetes bacterium]|nr:GAF domain-containing protein [Bacteroidota bacterium]
MQSGNEANSNEIDLLKNKLAQREAELAIISSVSEAISQQLDISSITKIIGDKVREIFKSEVTEILLLEKETNTIHIPYSYYRDYQNAESFSLGEGLTSKIIKSRKPLVLGSFAEQEKLGVIAQTEEEKTETYIGVPIIIGENVLGVVSIQSYNQNDFDTDKVQLLSILSTNMGTAIQNARLFEETSRLLTETEQRSAELAIINSVGEAMSKELDVSTVTKIVGDKVKEIFKAEVTEILLLNEGSSMISVPYSFYGGYETVEPFELGTGLTSKVIHSRKPLLLGDYIEQQQQGAIIDTNIGDADITETYLGIPILFNNNILGVVSIQSYKRNAYSDTDVRLLTTLSANMGIALQNARLFVEAKSLLEESKQRAIELGIINSVGEGLAKQLDFQSIVDLVGEKIREVFNAQIVSISTYDNSNSEFVHHRYVVEKNNRFYFDKPSPIDIDRKEIIEKRITLIFGTSEEIIAHSGEGILDGEMPQSFMGVPIVHNNVATGVITVQDLDQKKLYSEKDGQLLLTLASNMGVALENARLFEETSRLLNETQQRNAELAILNGIQEGLVEELNFNSIINLVGDKFREALKLKDIGIRIYDKEKNTLHFPYEYEHGERLEIPSGDPTPYSKYVIDTGKVLILNKNTEEEAAKLGISGSITIPGTDKSKSLIMVPIIVGNETKGLIRVENYLQEDAFSESEVRLLTTVSNTMSMALENARLFDESKKRAAELGSVNSISQAIAGHLEIDKLIYLVGEKVRTLFNADIVYLALLDKENSIINFPYGYGDEYPPLPLGEGLTSQIFLKKKPLLLNNEVGKKTQELGVERIGTKASSYLGVPIFVGEEIIGVLSVQGTEKENIFNMDDMRLLSTIAAHVGIAINNANSYKKLNSTLADLQATQNQLIQSEKMASLGELTAGIAHEIQNPLNFVNNFSEVNAELIDELNEEADKGNLSEVKAIAKDIKENEQKINHHGKRADAIVKGMLQHSRSSSATKEPTDINKLADEYLRLAYHGLRAKDKSFNANMKTDFDLTLEKINVIPQDFGRVILNLITNAFYVVTEKKKLNGEGYEPMVTVSTKKTSGKIIVSVTDNGNGIPQTILDKIFQPFFTTKPTGQGTGLGLSLSYDIITKGHGGELKVETKENVGTTFTIQLPTT